MYLIEQTINGYRGMIFSNVLFKNAVNVILFLTVYPPFQAYVPESCLSFDGLTYIYYSNIILGIHGHRLS